MLRPANAGAPASARQDDRTQQYLKFLGDVALQLPPAFNATICISMQDKATGPKQPIFSLQRSDDQTWLLLPDIDFLSLDFYEDARFKDTLPYARKVARAVFAGATSGGTNTVQRILAATLPRLRAAAFFNGRLDVDFRLPNIVQCDGDEARKLLEAQPYCQRPVLQWSEQFHSRFLISMDGNGATCSRVAVALASLCVLLKYDSDDMLYYFDGLVPHVHYVPIETDENVLAILAAERVQPGRYLPVADAGRLFAHQYLTRERVTEYMVRLLTGYAQMLYDGDRPQPGTPPRRVVAVARGSDGPQHFSETHDWVGTMQSGVALTSFKLLCQPRAESPRLYYQASTHDGGFTPTITEGTWCGEGAAITGIRLEKAREPDPLNIEIEARFIDGSKAKVSEMGVECRAESGSAIEAFRVRLA